MLTDISLPTPNSLYAFVKSFKTTIATEENSQLADNTFCDLNIKSQSRKQMFLYYSVVLSRVIVVYQELMLRANVLWGRNLVFQKSETCSADKINYVIKPYYYYSYRT